MTILFETKLLWNTVTDIPDVLAPVNLHSYYDSISNSINLTWESRSPDETGQRIYRNLTPTPVENLGEPYAFLGAGITEYEDVSVTEGQVYYYYVSAVSGGIEAISVELRAKTVLVPPFDISGEVDEGELWTPVHVTTELWLDAADASTVTLTSGRVSQWADKSGNNRHTTQDTTRWRPAYSTENQAVVFDGSSGLIAPNFSINEASVFFVSSSSGTEGYQTVVRNGGSPWSIIAAYPDNRDGVNTAFQGTGGVANSVFVTPVDRSLSSFSALYDLNAGKITRRHNGETLIEEDTLGNLIEVPRAWGIGCDNGNAGLGSFLRGTIRELVICPNPTGVENSHKIEGYLAWKWGLVDKLPLDHPYKDKQPMKGSV